MPNKLTTVPLRKEIDEKYKWHLDDIYKNKSVWEDACATHKKELPLLTAFKGKLQDNVSLTDCLALRDHINQTISLIFSYARMHHDSDANNTKYQSMTDQAMTLLNETNAAQSFIEPELLALPKEKLRTACMTIPSLTKYSFFLENLLRQKDHILSPLEENFLAKTGEIRQAPVEIFSIMTNADLTFPDTLTADGTKQPLTESRYNQFIRSKNRNVRKDAFHNLFSTYASFRNTFAATYSTSVKSTLFTSKARKYPSMIASALDSSNIPIAVYDTVIAATHDQINLLHRYVELKQRMLAIKDIHMYDLYVPVVPELTREFTYDTALVLLRDALQPLGKQYEEDLFHGIKSGWIDLFESKGKRNGAYSWGIYGVHPFVLLNYDKHYGSVSTLAHELGHAMHSYYSNNAQEYINSDYTIFCAEVASTTNENLLLEHMLKTVKNPQERLFFINQYLEQIRTTVYRQVLFAEFEKTVHEKAEQGIALTADCLENIWIELNKFYYGDKIIIDDALRIEWARIPHFYRPFYVYQYATGYAAAIMLANNLLKKGTHTQEDYLNYLKSGGSDYSISLLAKAGVDMTTSLPLEITFNKFAACLDELKSSLSK